MDFGVFLTHQFWLNLKQLKDKISYIYAESSGVDVVYEPGGLLDDPVHHRKLTAETKQKIVLITDTTLICN